MFTINRTVCHHMTLPFSSLNWTGSMCALTNRPYETDTVPDAGITGWKLLPVSETGRRHKQVLQPTIPAEMVHEDWLPVAWRHHPGYPTPMNPQENSSSGHSSLQVHRRLTDIESSVWAHASHTTSELWYKVCCKPLSLGGAAFFVNDLKVARIWGPADLPTQRSYPNHIPKESRAKHLFMVSDGM